MSRTTAIPERQEVGENICPLALYPPPRRFLRAARLGLCDVPPFQRDACARAIFVPGEPAAAFAQMLLGRLAMCSGRLAELYASG